MFTVIPLPVDKWSIIDIGCSLVNLISFSYLSTINYNAINDQNEKVYYNSFMILIVFSTWIRLAGIGFIINTFCILIVSVIACVQVTANFVTACLLYQITVTFFRFINF